MNITQIFLPIFYVFNIFVFDNDIYENASFNKTTNYLRGYQIYFYDDGDYNDDYVDDYYYNNYDDDYDVKI